MKNTFALLITLLFASCIKSYIPIPPPHHTTPPGGSGANIPSGISAVVNGKFTTFNSNLIIDTTNPNEIDVLAWGDSAGFTNAQLAFGFSAYNTPLVPRYYMYQPDGTPYSSGMTIYFWGAYNTKIGFTNYFDSTNVITITDSSCTGTVVNGTLVGTVMNQNYPYNEYDTTMTLSNMQFNLKW